MSDAGPEKRSFEKIECADLNRLAIIARDDLERFFEDNPQYKVYRSRLISVALCQGAAEHYVRGVRGVQDFDLYAFFRLHPSRRIPYRRHLRYDFGKSKFGRNPDNGSRFVGRVVDVFMRDVPAGHGEKGASAIRRYVLGGKKDSTPWYLAQRPIIHIYPEAKLGSVIWDPPDA